MQRAQAVFRKSISLLARCLRLSTVKSHISLRLQTLRSRGIGRGWTLARLEQRSRLAEPAVGVVTRRSLQAPRGAPDRCAHNISMTVANVVAVAAHTRSIPRRAAAAKVQCLATTQRKNRALPQHGRPGTSSLLSSWWQTMTRRALIHCTSCDSLAVGDSLMQIMHYGLWKSLAAVQRYLEHFDAISPDSSEWLFFFGWMTHPMSPTRTLSAFNSPGAPPVLQAQPAYVSPTIDLSDALAVLLEIDD
jgi:hypothetical protein